MIECARVLDVDSTLYLTNIKHKTKQTLFGDKIEY